MYRIELAPGEITVFRTIEELATGVRNGLITPKARIYHSASDKWLPIEFHPHYKQALELKSGNAKDAARHKHGASSKQASPKDAGSKPSKEGFTFLNVPISPVTPLPKTKTVLPDLPYIEGDGPAPEAPAKRPVRPSSLQEERTIQKAATPTPAEMPTTGKPATTEAPTAEKRTAEQPTASSPLDRPSEGGPADHSLPIEHSRAYDAQAPVAPVDRQPVNDVPVAHRTRTDHFRPDHSRTDHFRSDYSRSDHSQSDHSRSDHSQSDHSRSEHFRSDHSPFGHSHSDDVSLKAATVDASPSSDTVAHAPIDNFPAHETFYDAPIDQSPVPDSPVSHSSGHHSPAPHSPAPHSPAPHSPAPHSPISAAPPPRAEARVVEEPFGEAPRARLAIDELFTPPAPRVPPAVSASPVIELPKISYPEITPVEPPVAEHSSSGSRSKRTMPLVAAVVLLAAGGYASTLVFSTGRSDGGFTAASTMAERPVVPAHPSGTPPGPATPSTSPSVQPTVGPSAKRAAVPTDAPSAGSTVSPARKAPLPPASSGFAPALEPRAIVAAPPQRAAPADPAIDAVAAPAIDMQLSVPDLKGADSLVVPASQKGDSAMKRILKAVSGKKDQP